MWNNRFIKNILILLIFTLSNSCKEVGLECRRCDFIEDDISWKFSLNTPMYYGLIFKNNLVFFQNYEKNVITALQASNGQIAFQIEDYTSNQNKGYNVSLSVGDSIVLYESVIDEFNSIIKVYNIPEIQLVSEVPISTDKDLRSFTGASKLLFCRIINDNILIYALNDGSLNGYDIKEKHQNWKLDLGELVFDSKSIADDLFVFYTKSKVFSIDPFTGKQVVYYKKSFWSSSLSGIIIEDGSLLIIHSNGGVSSLNLSNLDVEDLGTLNINPVGCWKIKGTSLIAIADKNNNLHLFDTINKKTSVKYSLCARTIEVHYVNELNVLLVSDELGNLVRISLDTYNIECIYDALSTYSRFVVQGTHVFLNGYSDVILFQPSPAVRNVSD